MFNKSKSRLICYPSCISSEKYDIPDSVTSISDWSFCECTYLNSIIVPDSVEEIGEGAFYRCTSLEEIVIPDSVREFGWGVFNGCPNVVVVCSNNSMAAKMCEKKNIKHREK